MRNIFRTVLAAVLLSTAFTSCSDDEEQIPYVGSDNYISTFTLTTSEGLTYYPTITDGTIQLTVSIDEDLQGATVDYAISENATISPNPADVSDWSEAATFTVTSYNDEPRSYSYSVVKSDNINYTLNSQSEVDAFAAKGVEILDGSLSIGAAIDAEDPITSLDGLTSLKEIRYALTFGSKLSTDIKMDNLESVGTISFTASTVLETAPLTVSFASLQRVGTDITISSTQASISTVSLNSLEYVGGDLKIQSAALENISLSKLTTVDGDLTISGYAQTNSPAITSLNLLSLNSVNGIFKVEYLPNLSTFNISSLRSVSGLITFAKLDGLYVYELSDVDIATGLTVSYLGNVSAIINLGDNFDANFSLLVPTVAGDIMPTINGLKKAQDITITMNNFSGVLDLPELEQAGKISLTNNRNTETVSLSKLKEAEDIYIQFCSVLKTFSAPKLEKLTGYALYNNFTGALTSNYAFQLDINRSPKMASINMPKLAESGGDIEITNIRCTDYLEIDVNSLAKIDGTLKLTGGTSASYVDDHAFTSLECFSNLTSVNKVDIEYLKAITDFSPLKNIMSTLDSENWKVVGCGYNPTYENMVDGGYREIRTLTFEDADYKAGENYIGSSSWSSLIDPAEYDGTLLYSSTKQYTWTDTNNTFLNGVVNEGVDWNTFEADWKFWTGGIVVSNYYCDVKSGTEVSYERQLSVSNGSAGAAGNNGSANFAVVYDGAAGGMGTPVYLSFGDGTARTIDHLYISGTSYLESVAIDGNSLSSALGADDTYTVTAIGFDANDNETGRVSYEFVQGGKFTRGWNKWDLSSIGDVVKVRFSLSSSVSNDYGMSLPAYFAFDDVAVVM